MLSAVTVESLVQSYGYLALFIGTILEGETILVIAGFAAHQGYLELGWVMVVAFLGSFAGDQFWYQVGRHRGRAFLSRRPSWEQSAARVHSILDRHQIPLILGFRFLYGLRNITPFVIGASGFRPGRFMLLNAVGATIWASTVSVAGYLFGQGVEVLFENARKYEIGFFALIAGGGLVLWVVHQIRKRRRSRDGTADHGQ